MGIDWRSQGEDDLLGGRPGEQTAIHDEESPLRPTPQIKATGFNVNDFRTSIYMEGTLQANKYILALATPNCMQGFDASHLSLRCDRVVIPGMTTQTIDAIYRYGYGPAQRFPYNKMFKDVTLQFLLDKSASQYKFFHMWSNYIFNTNFENGIFSTNEFTGGDPYEVAYKSDYATTMAILVFNDDEDKVIEFTFLDAWPVEMQDLAMSWDSKEELVKLTVQMAYKAYYIKTARRSGDININKGEAQQGLNGLIPRDVYDASDVVNNAFNSLLPKLR